MAAAGRAANSQFVQKTQVRLAQMPRFGRRQQGDEQAGFAQDARHPGQERVQFQAMLEVVPEKTACAFCPMRWTQRK